MPGSSASANARAAPAPTDARRKPNTLASVGRWPVSANARSNRQNRARINAKTRNATRNTAAEAALKFPARAAGNARCDVAAIATSVAGTTARSPGSATSASFPAKTHRANHDAAAVVRPERPSASATANPSADVHAARYAGYIGSPSSCASACIASSHRATRSAKAQTSVPNVSGASAKTEGPEARPEDPPGRPERARARRRRRAREDERRGEREQKLAAQLGDG